MLFRVTDLFLYRYRNCTNIQRARASDLVCNSSLALEASPGIRHLQNTSKLVAKVIAIFTAKIDINRDTAKVRYVI